jgi:hypothetical protein
MIDLRKQIIERNLWIWNNRTRRKSYLSLQTGLSESRVKHIIAEMRKYETSKANA